MATEELGIRITAEGVFETTSGLKLTNEAVREVGDQLRRATKDGGAFARSQEEVARSTQQLTTRSLAAATAIGTVLGGALVAAGRAFAQKTRSVLDNTAAMDALTARTGITVERLGAYQYAASQADTDLNTLTSSLARLNKVMLDGQRDSRSESARTFRALGIDPDEIKSSEDALLRIADAFRKIDDPELKSALAQRLKLSQEIIPFLDRGAEGIRRLTDEGAKFNRITGEQAKSASEFKNQMAAFQQQVDSTFREMVGWWLPRMGEFLEQMREGTRIAGGFGSAIAMFGVGMAPTGNPAEKIKEYRKELDSLTAARARYQRSNADTSAIDQSIATLQKKIEFLRLLDRQAGGGKSTTYQTFSDAGYDAQRRAEQAARDALEKPGKEKKTATGSKRDEFADALEDIRRQGQAVEELSFVEKVAADIEAGRYKTLTTNQKIAIMQAAQEVTLRQQTAEVAKAQAEGDTARAEARRKAIEEDQQHWNTLAETAAEYQKQQKEQVEGWRDLVNPTREYVREIEKIGVALHGNKLSFDEAAAAADALRKKMADVGKSGKSDLEELKRAVEGYGRKAADAFVEWASGAKVSIRDVGAAMLKEFSSMMMYRQVFGPLFNAAAGKLSSAGQNFWNTGGGGVKFADLPTATPSARGNAFDGMGIVPFARGGLVDRPTIFPFARGGVGLMGEAGTEAIMPLKRTPDGRLGVAATVNGVGGGAPAAPPPAPNLTVNVVADARSDIATIRALTLQAVRGALSEQARLTRIGAMA